MGNTGGIVALVTVRTGSVRVPNKSMRAFGDTTLLKLKLETLLKVKGLDGIVVSSDGDDVLDVARSYGVTPHKRDAYYASADCSGSEFFHHLATQIEGDHFLYSPPTGPFVTAKTIEKVIEIYRNLPEHYDGVTTVGLVKEHLWLNGKPLNYSVKNSPNSQDLPDIYNITYGASLLSKALMAEYRNVVARSPYCVILDEYEKVDIDTMMDFMFAEYLYNREMRGLLKYEK